MKDLKYIKIRVAKMFIETHMVANIELYHLQSFGTKVLNSFDSNKIQKLVFCKCSLTITKKFLYKIRRRMILHFS